MKKRKGETYEKIKLKNPPTRRAFEIFYKTLPSNSEEEYNRFVRRYCSLM